MFDLEDFQDIDWTLFFTEQYIQVIFTSPLIVHETLLSVQYQPRSLTAKETTRLSDFFTSFNKEHSITFYFRGHFTHFVWQSLYNTLVPFLEETMNDALQIYEDTNPYTSLIAHATVSGFLTPLELVRTRLIVHSTAKSFTFPTTIYNLNNERLPGAGMWKSLYQPHLVIPTMIVHGVQALLRFGSCVFIENELGLDSTFHPITYRLAQIGCLAVENAVLVPLELGRKRLFAQRLDAKAIQYGKKEGEIKMDSCIDTFDGVYSNAFDVMSQVVSEEGKPSVDEKLSSLQDWESVYGGGAKKKDGIKGFGIGVKSLYRGFWDRYLLTVIQFITKEITTDY